MKKLLLIYGGCILSSSCFSQVEVMKPTLKGLPKGMSAVSSADLKFKYNGSTYKIGDILLEYRVSYLKHPYYAPIEDIRLQQIGHIRRLMRNANLNFSKIENVEGKKYAFTSYKNENLNCISFSSEINKDSLRVGGNMEYKDGEENKAKDVLVSFLKNIEW